MKNGSNNTVNKTHIHRFYSTLLRYNKPANGDERGETAAFAGKDTSAVIRDTSNACIHS